MSDQECATLIGGDTKTEVSVNNESSRKNSKTEDKDQSRRKSSTGDLQHISIDRQKIPAVHKPENETTDKPEDTVDSWRLLYRVSDVPPFLMTLLFALQQTLMGLPFCVMAAIMVAQSVCGDHDNDLKAQLLSTTVLLAAITTFLQTTFGVRLPVYQGPTVAYTVPLLVISSLPDRKCPPIDYSVIFNTTTGMNYTTDDLDILGYRESVVLPKVRAMQGSLILAGLIHMLIGLTGFVGVLLKVVGPLTVVPTLLLIGIEMWGVMNTFCEPHWGVSTGTFLVSMIFAVYLNGWNMPLPMYSRSRGCHIIRYPLQQVLAILFAIIIGWMVCGILTSAGALDSDPFSKQYKTRTDSGVDTIRRTPWFTLPYPGQFGRIEFSSGIFIIFIIATLLSVIESIADYYACARLSHLPPPPLSAMNRGIMVEGFMSMIAGFFGAGHATTTYSNNIGLIGITKVASRRVFQMLAIQMIVYAIVGKLGAVFVTIPYPVLGGSGILSFGLFLGVVLSYLQFTDMNSARNLAVLGTSLLGGLMVPNWVKHNSQLFKTGSSEFDQFLVMALTNPSLFGGLMAFLLDNTIKGTRRERGLAAWASGESQSLSSKSQIEEDIDVYEIPVLTKYFQKFPCFKYLPIFPTYSTETCGCKLKHPLQNNADHK